MDQEVEIEKSLYFRLKFQQKKLFSHENRKPHSKPKFIAKI